MIQTRHDALADRFGSVFLAGWAAH